MHGHCTSTVSKPVSSESCLDLQDSRHVSGVQPDQRFEHVVSLVRNGTFGWADFFEPVMESITSGGDYYLLANDFPSYIEAQVCRPSLLQFSDRLPQDNALCLPSTCLPFCGSHWAGCEAPNRCMLQRHCLCSQRHLHKPSTGAHAVHARYSLSASCP